MIIPPKTVKRQSTIENPFDARVVGKTMFTGPMLFIDAEPKEDIYRVEIPRHGPNDEVAWLVDWVGEREVSDEIDAATEHAWLVVLGHFAQELGLITALEGVSLKQRQGAEGTPPQAKLIEFLVGILGGIEYLQELNRGAQPIVKDPLIAAAWEQGSFRHYSQVSRSLEVADEETLQDVLAVLRQVSEPFIQEAVMAEIKHKGELVIDIDLTGRPVSSTSHDYPGADFGWMGDEVKKGYQAAISSLANERWGRLLLSLQRYAGRNSSADCLQEAVRQGEAGLQLRPRRRVELLEQRRQEMAVQLEQLQAQEALKRQKQEALWSRIRQARADVKVYQAEVACLEAEYQLKGWQERPQGKLAKQRRQLLAVEKRESRAWRDLKKVQAQTTRLTERINAVQEKLLALDEWRAYLEADNMHNPNPVPITIRIDAGFSTGPNLAWLIEMGYTVLTKAHHGRSANSLRHRLPHQATWTRVGQNAQAVAMGDYYQNECPYPLQALLLCYHLPHKLRYTTLFYYDQNPPPALPAWFKLYNARQTIEAGIKEGKSVFTLKRHLVRSPIGMQLQEQFALFGANFVRWAAAWVKNLLSQANHSFIQALGQVKTLTRIVSRSRARWVRNALGNALIFDETGPFAGTILCLTGSVAIQLPLRLFNFAPS